MDRVSPEAIPSGRNTALHRPLAGGFTLPSQVDAIAARQGRPGLPDHFETSAIGRRRRAPTFPDTELRFNVEASLRRLGTSSITAAVLPLPLGPGEYQPPAFVYSSIAITAAPA
jgi:hypothetical protein